MGITFNICGQLSSDQLATIGIKLTFISRKCARNSLIRLNSAAKPHLPDRCRTRQPIAGHLLSCSIQIFSLNQKLFHGDWDFRCRPQRQEMKTLVRLWKRQLVKARLTLPCLERTPLQLWISLYFKVLDSRYWPTRTLFRARNGDDRMAANTGIAFLDTNNVEVQSVNLPEMKDLTGKEMGSAGITEIIADDIRRADRRMKPSFEKVGAGSASVAVFERSDPEFPFYWHYHPEFELTLIINSRGQRLVGDGIADYGPGDLVLLGPNVPHSWRSGPVKTQRAETHRAVVVQFRHDFLGEHFFELEEMAPVAHLLRRASNGLAFGHTEIGRRVARSIAKLPVQSPGKRLATLLSALVELAEEKNGQILSTLRVKPTCRIADQHRIDEICLFLNDNFTEDIEFARLAKRFHMDQASLCRFFKRATGRTMTAYLNELRVGAAAQLLINTNDSILDIGFRVGFGNYSNFHRQFKRIKGFGPRKLRHQFSLGTSPDDRFSTDAHTAGHPVHREKEEITGYSS